MAEYTIELTDEEKAKLLAALPGKELKAVEEAAPAAPAAEAPAEAPVEPTA